MTEEATPTPVPAPSDSARNFTWATYAMYAVGLFTGLFALVGVIMAYAKKEEFASTIYQDHLRYLIRTFWGALIGCIVGFLLLIIFIGWFILMAVTVWYIYRIVMGAIRLYDGKTVSTTSWL